MRNNAGDNLSLDEYVTEILVGLLENRKDMLAEYANTILGMSGDKFSIQSKRNFYLDNSILYVVDMVVENENSICFIEHKVFNNTVEDEQLKTYKYILDNMANNKDKYIRYCSKNYDKKDVKGINFDQFRWCDVYDFLKKFESDQLVKEYMDFLTSQRLGSPGEFNSDDLIILSNIHSTFYKINECMDILEDNFAKNFGNVSRTSQIHQLERESGFWLWATNIFGGEETSQAYMGFYFGNSEKTTPYLSVGILCEATNPRCELFNKHVERSAGFFDFIEVENGVINVFFREPLSKFVLSSNQFKEITAWFVGKIGLIDEFKNITMDLNWTLITSNYKQTSAEQQNPQSQVKFIKNEYKGAKPNSSRLQSQSQIQNEKISLLNNEFESFDVNF